MSPWEPEGEPHGKGTKPVTLPRPGHADLAGVLKYGHDDVRNALERASARHTATHVAAGAVAKALLATIGISVAGRPLEIGGARGDDGMREATDAARKDRDTLGGIVEVVAGGCPPGLGSYAEKSDRLDARLAFALMGIQAVKGVEVGDGFALARVRGSEAHDEIDPGLSRRTNRAGGLEAGITNGEQLVVRAAMKPLPTLMKPLDSVDLDTGEAAQALVERSRRPGGRGARGRRRGGGRLGARLQCQGQVRRRRDRRLRRRSPRLRRAHPMAANALKRHLALAGFMGAGKTTLGEEVAGRLGRRFVDLDREIERQTGASVEELFARDGEAVFRDDRSGNRRVAARRTGAHGDRPRRRHRALCRSTREVLSRRAFTVLLEVEPAVAWQRASSEGGRPLAIDEQAFHALYRRAAADVRGGCRRPRARRGRDRPRCGRHRRPDRGASTCWRSSCPAAAPSRSSPTRTWPVSTA